LIRLLQAGRPYNTETLSHLCGVSRRTIFRDLDLLREGGVDLRYDEAHQRYQVGEPHFLPVASFTADEALMLVVLCHDMAGQLPVPMFGPARSAAIKLERILPSRLREQVRLAGEALKIQIPPTNRLVGREDVYQKLLEAITTRRAVRMAYRSPAEETQIVTRLHPYRLLFSRRSWYVVGRSSIHRATRTFHVGRICDLAMLDDPYEIPRGFSIQRYLRNAWHMIAEPGPDREVVVRFSRRVAQNVAEIAWHATQRLKYLDDGSLEFSVTVSGLHEISWWILGYGDQAEVVEPAELRDIVAGHAMRMLDRYRSDPSGPAANA
jgi:proteasome accessory factor B